MTMKLYLDDIKLTEKDFLNFKKLVQEKCGIHLHEGKKELVRARLGKRLRETQFKTFRQYYNYLVEEDTGEELTQVLNAISTNLTSFFRESNHFSYLEKEILPFYLNSSHPRQLNIWSAGCSSGEEAYSLAICLQENLESQSPWRAKILATDISTKVLSKAVSGVYYESRIENIPHHVIRKYFQKGQGRWNGYFRLKPLIRNMVAVKRFNLMSPFYFDKNFDIIFCRNVMIYFDKKVQEKLVNKFCDRLNPGGHLFIGHSDFAIA